MEATGAGALRIGRGSLRERPDHGSWLSGASELPRPLRELGAVTWFVGAQDRDALGRGMKAIGARLVRAVNRIARRSLPPSPPPDAEGSAKCAVLRPAECAPSPRTQELCGRRVRGAIRRRRGVGSMVGGVAYGGQRMKFGRHPMNGRRWRARMWRLTVG